MPRALRWVILALAPVAFAGVVSCGGGGEGGRDDGDGADVVGFGFNEASMEFAAGLGAQVVDAFPPVTDLLTSALVELAQGSTTSGEARALQACAAGTASLRWNDASGDGAWSAGDTARLELDHCRVHTGDAGVLGGSLTLTFSSVVRGPPRSVVAKLDLALDTDDGTLRGLVALTATSSDGEHHGLVYQPSGASIVTVTGSTPLQLGCFDVRDDPHPELGVARRVAIIGVIRTADKIISFDPGGKLLYGPGDLPVGGSVGLLSISTPLCTDVGVDPGGVRSDNSRMIVIAGEDGVMRLELYRAGSIQPDHSEERHWNELLHPSAGGIINGTSVADVAGVAAFALDLPRQVGAVGLDLVAGVSSGHPVPLCSAGGYSVSSTGPLVVGHVATVTFGGCVTGEAGDLVTLHGSVTVTVTGVTGDPASDAYTLATSVSGIDLRVVDDVGESSVTGAFRFERTAAAGAITEQSDSEAGATLALTEDTGTGAIETRLLSFSVRSERSGSSFTLASPGDTMVIAASGVSGELAVTVTGAVSGVEPNPPHTGDLKVTASDASNVAMHLAGGGAVTLELDDDGDGVVDATIPTTWDSLD